MQKKKSYKTASAIALTTAPKARNEGASTYPSEVLCVVEEEEEEDVGATGAKVGVTLVVLETKVPVTDRRVMFASAIRLFFTVEFTTFSASAVMKFSWVETLYPVVFAPADARIDEAFG